MIKRRYLLISGVPLALLLLLLALCPGAGVPEPAAAGPNSIPGRYIVVFKDNASSVATVSSLEQSINVVPDVVYNSAIHGFAAEMSDAQARALARNPSVALVEPDRMMSVDLHTNNFQTVPTGVDRIDADQHSTSNITNQANGTSLNIDVAVIDTGVDTQHPDLNAAGGMGFTGGGCSNTAYEDDFGHGTHVAGTIAARDDDRGVVGVAPGARIWAVKVLDSSGSGADSCVIKGVDWVTNRRTEFNNGAGDGDPGIDIRVANMSLGGGNDPAICQAIADSATAGVIYAVAAGNSGEDAANSSPANCASAITVSAFADFDGKPGALSNLTATFGCGQPSTATVVHDDTFACFSDYGPDVDIAAPGVSIVSTYMASSNACGALPYCYATMSGTSMATPHVAGALAVFLLATNYNGSALGPAVMAAFTVAGYARPQNSVCGFAGDPDNFHEPVLYIGNSCGLLSTPSPSPSPSATNSPTPSPTHSPTLSPTHSPTPSPTQSPTPSPSPTSTNSPTPTPSPTATTLPTSPPTASPTPTPTPSPTPSPSPSPMPTHIQGDANCDNHVTTVDALQILLEISDLSSSSACVGAPDVNCNGHKDSQDVLIILQYLSGHTMSVSQCPVVGSSI